MQTLVQSANSIWQRSKHGAWTLDQMFFLVLGNGRLKKLRSASSASMLGLEELAGIVEQHGVPAAGEQQRPQARCGGNELSLDELADIAAQHGVPAAQQQRPRARCRRPQARGGGPRARGRGCGRRRYNFQAGQTARRRSKAMRKRHEASRRLSSQLQAVAANASGRSRTGDHLFCMQSDEKRSKIAGSAGWKVWTPEALLRAAFSKPSAALRQVAQEIDGASPSHVMNARMFVADVILEIQRNGLQQQKGKATHLALSGAPPRFWIQNLMFDETELNLKLEKEGPGAWSILASHAQLSIFAGQDVAEFDVIRLPQALPRKTTSCMWSALSLQPGGLGPGNMCLQAEHMCILVTCDQAAANIKLLKHLHAQLPEKCLLLPMLCAQHRNGNVVERITQLLGILPGSYCLAKCSSNGKQFKDWKTALQKQLDQDLIVLSAVPPGLQAEWAVAERQATKFLELVLEGLADDCPGLRPGVSATILAFTKFFRGPWTGPMG